MNFIQRRIQQKKQQQEEQLRRTCSYSIQYLDTYISTLKNDIKNLLANTKNILDNDAYILLWDIENIEMYYSSFLHDLKQEEFTYKETYFKNIKEESKQKAEFMHKIKKQYRAEFESIYDNFKRISKGCNFPRRNEILGLMRKAFDFDSSKYYAHDQFMIMH